MFRGIAVALCLMLFCAAWTTYASNTDQPIQGGIVRPSKEKNSKGAQGTRQKPRTTTDQSILQSYEDLIQVANSCPAKYETPQGKAFPIFTCPDSEAMAFLQKLMPLIQEKLIKCPRPIKKIDECIIWADAWHELGYSGDSSLYEAYKNFPKNENPIISSLRMNPFSFIYHQITNEQVLKKMLELGIVSRASAVTFLNCVWNYAKFYQSQIDQANQNRKSVNH